MAVSGSIRKLLLAGVNYPVKAEADFNQTGRFETEGIKTSGEALIKKTARVPQVEGVEIIADSVAQAAVEELGDSLENFDMAWTEADGTFKSGQGQINIEGFTTAERTMTLTLIPSGVWEIFTA